MTITLSLPTGRPKRDIIELAFDDCGLAGYEFDRTADEQTMALRKLNAMMDEWPWSLLGYSQPAYGVGQIEEPSGIPNEAVSTVGQYLARRIVPGMGGAVSDDLKATLARSFSVLLAQTATIPDMSLPGNTPLGSGRRGYRSRFSQAG